ncbi:hypothetical protein ONS95_004412 [Cadophora gregata]|uniref:uncharacterized protein n=1 Tax=Cadophora gregata TaxID=51156 RepID=UPI0026DA8ADA|nr:uncharacterized protein ONS95_004412 [Cadophora gregata]KAK0105193.1 hypothetical protein ONS96_004594 [Cadophora gregata f. sp. sojae]KAK0105899.1 hypothetical protein ONS95_004412 [Cadophora gregata]
MGPISEGKSQTPQRPQITSSNSPEYRHKLADISSRATFSDSLNSVFQAERVGPASKVKLQDLYDATLFRIETKVGLGSHIVEADNFAAVACWEPPGAVHPNHTVEELEELALTRPIYSGFIRDIEAARTECLGEQKCWQLTLMARDPLRTSKGAVRAIIEPYVKRAEEERVPIWCVAGNEHARDVYAYFGFKVVRIVYSGPDRVQTWCMVCNWPKFGPGC